MPSTMWFMFRTSPVRATHGHMGDEEGDEGGGISMRKWSDRPICRLPGHPGYQGKRFVNNIASCSATS